ncbi:MAG: hypothetical protein J4G04_08430 [Nitrosopumilaceae archaeon]|nr:hypothetical protein [Nitrosopumilaceae archaeon]
MLAIAEAFDRLAPQEATVDVREHVQALLLALMGDVTFEDPEMVIRLVSADETPLACPHCGSDFIKYGSKGNHKGSEQTYLCKGPNQHRVTFNPGLEEALSQRRDSQGCAPLPRSAASGRSPTSSRTAARTASSPVCG